MMPEARVASIGLATSANGLVPHLLIKHKGDAEQSQSRVEDSIGADGQRDSEMDYKNLAGYYDIAVSR